MLPVPRVRQQTTRDIIASENSAFHLRLEVADLSRPPSDDFGNPWISSRSRWRDYQWYLDNHTPGQGSKAVQWHRQLHDGSYLTDFEHAELLDAFRRLLWSLFVDPRAGKALSAGTGLSVARGIHLLAWWMVKNAYRHFGQLDGASSLEFRDDVPGLIDEVGQARRMEEFSELEEDQDGAADDDIDDDERDNDSSTASDLQDLGLGQVYLALNVWRVLWIQRNALTEAGCPAMPEKPFEGKSTSKVARDIANRQIEKIPPLPDEVAAPTMAAAYRLIGTPADDVIALQRLYIDTRQRMLREHSRSKVKKIVRNTIRAFQFSTLLGETTPWHDPLEPITTETLQQDEATLNEAQRLRGLVRTIRDAAVIVLQSSSGQRINEICSLKAGLNQETGLPACVRIQKSPSGLSELFYVRGHLSKTKTAPVEVEWLLGSRPVGSDWMPPPVQALAVLLRLFEPWREIAEDPDVKDSMIVAFSSTQGLPFTASSVGRITGNLLRDGQKDFLRQWVDLSGLPNRNARDEDLARYRDSQGTCITTHQWRKTYALYLFRINNSLIPAISQQFKHLSLAMTERAYIGNDIALLRDIDAAHVQQTVNFWKQLSPGQKVRFSGRMGKIIEKYRPEIEEILAGLEGQAVEDAMESWVLRHDLRIFHNADGKCLIRVKPTAARCHKVAGTPHWSNKTPNYAARDTSTCLGCDLFVIDGEHEEFWVQRYTRNQAAWLIAQAAGDTRDYRVVKKRADQAKVVLCMLGTRVPKVEFPHAP